MRKLYLGVILIAYLVLSVSYALGPLFEAPDEALHYEYVRFIADEKAFPDPYTRTWSQFPQAPLYYMLLSPILMVMPDSHFAQKYGPNTYSPYPDQDGITPPNKAWENPYFVSSPDRSLLRQNRNFLLHSRSENFPYKDDPTARTAFVLRIASIAMGVITLWYCYQIFMLLWPQHLYRRILALSSIAFLPLFQRVSASVNNDNLSILLGTLALYLILMQINRSWTFKRSICLGVVLGLALSTKTYAGMLAVPVGIAIILERRSWRYAPLILLLTILFGGWWYLHNLATHGWLIANDHPQILNTSANGKNEFVLDHALKTFPDIFTNMFARFDTLLVNIWLDRLFLIGLGLGFAGTAYIAIAYLRQIVVSGWSESYWLNVRQSLVIVTFILGWFATIFYASGVQSYGTQGRYALNAMAGLAVLLTLGWTAWIPSRLEGRFSLSMSSGLFAVAVIVLAGYFQPAFSPLPVSPTIEHVLNYRYEDTAKLLGTDNPVVEGQPGDTVEVVLNWEAISPAESRHVVVYVGAEGDERISQHSYPAGGNLLASDWDSGQQWSEHHFLEIPADTESQRIYPLTAGLYDVPSAHTFTAYDSAGNEIFPTIGQLIVHGRPAANPDYVYRFGEVIGLQEPIVRHDEGQLQLCLTWVSLKRVETDYHYFAHVVEDDELASQVDGQPRQGDYPTSAWLPGEVIEDCVPVDVDSTSGADRQINIGLYELETFQRLPITGRDDNASFGDFVTVASPARDEISR